MRSVSLAEMLDRAVAIKTPTDYLKSSFADSALTSAGMTLADAPWSTVASKFGLTGTLDRAITLNAPTDYLKSSFANSPLTLAETALASTPLTARSVLNSLTSAISPFTSWRSGEVLANPLSLFNTSALNTLANSPFAAFGSNSVFFNPPSLPGVLGSDFIRVPERTTEPAGYEEFIVEDEHSDGLSRNNRAHHMLQVLEMKMRSFVSRSMLAVFGEGWEERQVPPWILANWKWKRKRARQYDRVELPLIQYADFTDYLQIIIRQDNWRCVFSRVFGRRESVSESMQRLYPIRLDTMHARLISSDDELYLRSECRRLLHAID